MQLTNLCPSWGIPYENDGGARQKFLKNTLKGTRILFDRRGLNIFLLLRGTNFKQHKTHPVILFIIFISESPHLPPPPPPPRPPPLHMLPNTGHICGRQVLSSLLLLFGSFNLKRVPNLFWKTLQSIGKYLNSVVGKHSVV